MCIRYTIPEFINVLRHAARRLGRGGRAAVLVGFMPYATLGQGIDIHKLNSRSRRMTIGQKTRQTKNDEPIRHADGFVVLRLY